MELLLFVLNNSFNTVTVEKCTKKKFRFLITLLAMIIREIQKKKKKQNQHYLEF